MDKSSRSKGSKDSGTGGGRCNRGRGSDGGCGLARGGIHSSSGRYFVAADFGGGLAGTEGIIFCFPEHSIHEVMSMDKKTLEKQQQKKSSEEFNSITRKTKVENQNQTHNVRKEGITPINQKR